MSDSVPMVYAFEFEHPVGSVCGDPCQYCRTYSLDDREFTDAFGDLLPPQPLYIVRRATREEWVAWLESQGSIEPRTPWEIFYEVATD